jgi:hypothetical protein
MPHTGQRVERCTYWGRSAAVLGLGQARKVVARGRRAGAGSCRSGSGRSGVEQRVGQDGGDDPLQIVPWGGAGEGERVGVQAAVGGVEVVGEGGQLGAGGGVDAQFGLAPGPGDGVGVGVGDAGFQADAIWKWAMRASSLTPRALQVFAEVLFGRPDRDACSSSLALLDAGGQIGAHLAAGRRGCGPTGSARRRVLGQLAADAGEGLFGLGCAQRVSTRRGRCALRTSGGRAVRSRWRLRGDVAVERVHRLTFSGRAGRRRRGGPCRR